MVGNEHINGLAEEAPPIVYYPSLVEDLFGLKMLSQWWMVYVIRSTRTGSPTFTKEIQQAVSSVDPNIALADVHTLEIMTESMAQAGHLTCLFVRHGLPLAGLGSVLGWCRDGIVAPDGVDALRRQRHRSDDLRGGVSWTGRGAALATYLPSRRAARVDPVEMLRAV